MESRLKVGGIVDSKTGSNVIKKRQSRGREHSNSGRGRGSRVNDRTKVRISSPTGLQSNGLLENSYQNVSTVSTKFVSLSVTYFSTSSYYALRTCCL